MVVRTTLSTDQNTDARIAPGTASTSLVKALRPSASMAHLIHFRVLAVDHGGAAGADGRDRVFDLDRSRLRKLQGHAHVLALLERLLEIHEHHVITARLEFDRFARLDLEPVLDLAHFHHALLHGHGVDLEAARKRDRTADQTVGLSSGVDDFHVAGADRGAFRGRARPRLHDFHRTDLIGLGDAGRGNQHEGAGKSKNFRLHRILRTPRGTLAGPRTPRPCRTAPRTATAERCNTVVKPPAKVL